MTDIKTLGAVGDGVHDESSVFAEALKSCRNIFIPEGDYMVSETLLIPSHTTITADRNAHIFRKKHTQIGRKDFLVSNADTANGNEDITICGGRWDGNASLEDRGDDLFDQSSTTGVMLNFRNVRGVTLSDMTLSNPLCYYTRFCEAENVTIERIRFSSDIILPNQDGIHLAGFCRGFTVRDLFGEEGSPNDDFIALNADDASARQECFDTVNGPVENIVVENIHSDLCHCFVRLLSVFSPIKNITVKNVSGTCKSFAVNLDAARYCRTPLFSDSDYPNGVGHIENVRLADFAVTNGDKPDAYICLETNCTSFDVKKFRNTGRNGAAFLFMNHMCEHNYSVRVGGTVESSKIDRDKCVLLRHDTVDEFSVTKSNKN